MRNKFIVSLSILTILATSVIADHALDKVPANISEVYAPIVVAIPPVDAFEQLSLLSDGRLRHYNGGAQAVDFEGNTNYSYHASDFADMYIESSDSGLHWDKVKIKDGKKYGTVYNPKTKKYYSPIVNKDGSFLLKSDADGNFEITQITPDVMNFRAIEFIKNGDRIICLNSLKWSSKDGDIFQWGARSLISDDDGKTWRTSNVIRVPDHKAGGIHKGIRWNHNAVEPAIIEQKDGVLRVIVRTSLDKFWQAFSSDGGLTWSKPEESPFYGTSVMPTIGRLKDGTLVMLFCNATPLPEVEGADGVWEDVFTNRNIVHIAVSKDDGKTWSGFRELYADPRRNASDYATAKGADKSAHQTQFVEVSPNKIVAAIGQNRLNRVITAFDVNWALEKSRKCDFSNAADDWSVFNYKKGMVGHCGYNRIVGCRIVDNPDVANKKCLEIKYIKDSSLVSDLRGGVWNFPALKKGTFKARIKGIGKNSKIRLNLNDRWFNPTDSTAEQFAMFTTNLALPKGWHDISITWDLEKSDFAILRIDANEQVKLPLLNKSEHGLSYVHFITDADTSNEGVLIDFVEAQSN